MWSTWFKDDCTFKGAECKAYFIQDLQKQSFHPEYLWLFPFGSCSTDSDFTVSVEQHHVNVMHFCLSVWLPWGRVLDYEIMFWNMQGIKKHLRDPLLQDLGGVFVIKSQALLCYFDQSFLDISKLIMAQMLQYLVGFSNYSLGILLCNSLLQQLLATGNSNASIFSWK